MVANGAGRRPPSPLLIELKCNQSRAGHGVPPFARHGADCLDAPVFVLNDRERRCAQDVLCPHDLQKQHQRERAEEAHDDRSLDCVCCR